MAERDEKIRIRSLIDQANFEQAFKDREDRSKQMRSKPVIENVCISKPPFWWQDQNQKINDIEPSNTRAEEDLTKLGNTTYQSSYLRWHAEPNLTVYVEDDPCKRKREMRM